VPLSSNQPVLHFIVPDLPGILRLEDKGRFIEFSERQCQTSAHLQRARLAPPENLRCGSDGAYAWSMTTSVLGDGLIFPEALR